jgi:Uri superfamily endonuclease
VKPEPGTYVLVLKSVDRKRVQIGKWGQIDTDIGNYLYIGSALQGEVEKWVSSRAML